MAPCIQIYLSIYFEEWSLGQTFWLKRDIGNYIQFWDFAHQEFRQGFGCRRMGRYCVYWERKIPYWNGYENSSKESKVHSSPFLPFPILVTGNKGIHHIRMLGFTALSNRNQFYLIKWNLTYWEDLCKAGRLWKRTDWKPMTVLMGWRAKTQKVFKSRESCWHKTQDIISYCCHVSLRSSPLHILPSLPLIFKIQCFWGENWPGYDKGRAQCSWPWRGKVCPLLTSTMQVHSKMTALEETTGNWSSMREEERILGR